MTEARRVVIVGGGVTGLAAAHAAVASAREAGRAVDVTVLERSTRFGGKLVTERAEGYLLDGGADSWVVSKPQATDLARELGLGGALISTNEASRRFYVAFGGGLHAVPEGLVLGVPTRVAPLARTRLFSWRGKARMALEPFVPARRFEGDDDESIADFATRRLGREAAERLVAPLLGGISSGDASDISVRAAFPQLVAIEQKHGSLVRGMRAAARERASSPSKGGAFVSLEGGVGALVAALVEKVRTEGVTLRSGASVRAVARKGRGWTVDVEGAERIEADALLLAVPGYVAADLLESVDADACRTLAGFRYGSTATVFLGYRRADVAHPLDGVGFVVPREMGRPILAGTWVSSKWRGRAPEGHVLLRAFFGGAWGDDALARGDADLVRLAEQELLALMGISAEPVLTRVFRFDRASAQMRVGHLATMRTLHERLAKVAPGLLVAGGGYDGVGIPDCIRQGQEAGRALVAP
jgi:oxygen-dependent protoporphyrinogen oxidase